MRLLSLCLLAIISCKQPVIKTENVEKKIEIYPEELNFSPGYWLEGRISISKTFNLPLLFKRPEEFELRIIPWQASWLRFGMGRDIFVFKLDSIGWTGFHYFNYSAPVNSLDGITSAVNDTSKIGDNTIMVKKLKPLCGWANFSDSIGYFQIEQLPTQELIKDFKEKGLLDGYGYEIEISRPTSYRFLSYSNPSAYNYPECRKIDGFMEMIRRQLNKDYCWPECSH